MFITTEQQLEELRSTIGSQNVTGCKRALADGAKVWVFLSREEVLSCSDLEPDGVEFCLKERFDKGETWAGWIHVPQAKIPKMPIIPGITPSPYHDTHGNLSSGGSGGNESRY